MHIRLRPYTDEIAKDREALSIYADPKNWMISRGRAVFVGPLTGPEVAQRALEECNVPKAALPRSSRRIYKRLTRV